MPPEWFGLNPDYGEDSAEVIDSSVEEEDEVEDGSETEAPEDGADGQPQLDRASSNEPCRASRLPPEVIKPRPPSRPPQHPTPPSPPIL